MNFARSEARVVHIVDGLVLLQGDNEISNLQQVLISIVLHLTLASIALCGLNCAYLLGSGVDVCVCVCVCV